MEIIIVAVIVIAAGYILYSNIKKRAKGDCGCGSNCNSCGYTCPTKSTNAQEDKKEL